jgi:hypothetical protein
VILGAAVANDWDRLKMTYAASVSNDNNSVKQHSGQLCCIATRERHASAWWTSNRNGHQMIVPLECLASGRGQMAQRDMTRDAALGEKIDDILIGQRVAQSPTHGPKNGIARETIVLQRGSTWHDHPQKPELCKAGQSMHQSHKGRFATFH